MSDDIMRSVHYKLLDTITMHSCFCFVKHQGHRSEPCNPINWMTLDKNFRLLINALVILILGLVSTNVSIVFEGFKGFPLSYIYTVIIFNFK